jgi:large repetitive protein
VGRLDCLKDHCGNSAELLFTFEIWPRRFTISTDALKAGTVNAPYSATLATAGVRSNVTWKLSAGSLPAGLALSSNGGITGTPTAVGSSTFTVTATGVSTDPSADGTRIDTKQFTLSVLQPLTASVSRRVAEVGVPFRATLKGTGGQSPYTWSASGLPVGLTVDSGGTISGTPARAGSYPVQFTLTDANGTPLTQNVTFTVAPKLAITTRSLRTTVGHSSRLELRKRGGFGRVTWTIVRGHLPAGLGLDRRTGTIAGAARAAGSERVTFRARDAAGGVSRKTVIVTATG